MKIVLDTNVLVSGLLKPFSAPGEIVRLLASGDITLCYDSRILTEYRQVLKRPKFSFDSNAIEYLLEQIKHSGKVISAKPLKKRLIDPDDEPFMETALSSEAAFLVTGNIKHYPKSKSGSVCIITPAAFIDELRKKE